MVGSSGRRSGAGRSSPRRIANQHRRIATLSAWREFVPAEVPEVTGTPGAAVDWWRLLRLWLLRKRLLLRWQLLLMSPLLLKPGKLFWRWCWGLRRLRTMLLLLVVLRWLRVLYLGL